MRCPVCEELLPSGPGCETEDTNCFAWDGDGTEVTPKTVSPVLDPDGDNMLTCGEDGILGQLPAVLANPPACRVFRTTNLGVANNTLTAVNFNQEEYDTDTMHSVSASTSRITVNTDGVYVVTFNATWNKNVTGYRYAAIRKNGTDILGAESKMPGQADLYVAHALTVQHAFVATDYVEGVVLQTSGGSLSFLVNIGSPALEAARVA